MRSCNGAVSKARDMHLFAPAQPVEPLMAELAFNTPRRMRTDRETKATSSALIRLGAPAVDPCDLGSLGLLDFVLPPLVSGDLAAASPQPPPTHPLWEAFCHDEAIAAIEVPLPPILKAAADPVAEDELPPLVLDGPDLFPGPHSAPGAVPKGSPETLQHSEGALKSHLDAASSRRPERHAPTHQLLVVAYGWTRMTSGCSTQTSTPRLAGSEALEVL
mmetsp:Transcript_127984/g.370364  ORF Transcript_127984/g.370364 Transcript_127984/m.370364 type:complete len:218 (+) Transcript_127984:85-738(+)